jgi:hypothetical protein
MQTGWFKEVHVKDIDSHSVRALLASRALLVKIKRDLENHVRGLLKNLGLVIGRAKFNVFAVEMLDGTLANTSCSLRGFSDVPRGASLNGGYPRAWRGRPANRQSRNLR